jgi:hypothetical protein
MLEIVGDIWDFYNNGTNMFNNNYIAITTNGDIKRNGEAVMGAGIALEAAKRFPELPKMLGKALYDYGNIPFDFKDLKIFTFPTKNHWNENSNLEIIRHSANIIRSIWLDIHEYPGDYKLYIPRPGCGCGNLPWGVVRDILEKIFIKDEFTDYENFVIVHGE